MNKIVYLLEMMNGAEGISDIEGKVASVGDERVGKRASFNGAEGISDIEGKATRVGASERGQRTSFKSFANLDQERRHVSECALTPYTTSHSACVQNFVVSSELPKRSVL